MIPPTPPRLWSPLRLLTLALTSLLTAGVASAEVSSLPFPPPPPSASATLAGQLAAALFSEGEALAGRPFEIEISYARAPKGIDRAALSEHLAATLEVALRGRAHLGPRVTERAAERVSLSLIIEAGALSIAGRRTALPRNIWQRLRHPEGQVVATAFVSQPLDIELRTLLGLGRRQVRLDRLRIVPVGQGGVELSAAPILDLRVTDLDGDLRPELVIVQPLGVTLLGWDSGHFSEPLGRFDLSALMPNPARLRQPLGRLVEVVRADGRRFVVAASSERARAALLTWDGRSLSPLALPTPSGWPLYATGSDAWVTAPWPHGLDTLSGPLTEVRLDRSAPVELSAADALYDLRAFGLRAATSPSWDPHLATVAVGGALELWSASRPEPRAFTQVGTAFVLTDLDADGAAELLTTGVGLGPRDSLTLDTEIDGGHPRRRWAGEVGAPVTAMAAGDVDRDGYQEIIVATWDGARAELIVVVPRT